MSPRCGDAWKNIYNNYRVTDVHWNIDLGVRAAVCGRVIELSGASEASRRGMLRAIPLILIFVLSASLAIAVGVEETRVHTARARIAEVALAGANAEASRDSTREVVVSAGVLRDSVRVVERRAVQERQHGDALDAALGRERRGPYALSVSLDSLRVQVRTHAVEDSNRVRWAEFNFRAAPYTVSAEVVIPAPPDSARMGIRIVADSIPLAFRVSCDGKQGVQRASIVAESAPWAKVKLGTLSQDTGVCAIPEHKVAGRSRWLPRAVIGYGRAITVGSGSWGVFVGVGLTL